ncbi:DUF2178 domain-containing protein [Candidatus Peregrinibacteria bacterium]|nr:DUF2178 domain-containing protein [Candidatus Peregrinibacteria bacterium]
MKLKQYKTIKILITILLAIIFTQGVIYKEYLIPLAAMVVAALLLTHFRGRVKEIVADERDYEIGGKAALLTIRIYAWIAVIPMMVLYAYRDLNPGYQAVAMTLAFSTCILMLIYNFIFRYHNKVKFTRKTLIYWIVAFVVAFFLTIMTLRVFSGEDSWMCQNGQWVKHGQPSFPAPITECK